ncbi:MAG: hypothetical protein WDW38_010399 [Sanguina aurantia]
MTSSRATTLADVLIMVPDLHPQHLASTKVTTIQQLRLVCKSVCSAAQSTVQSFSLSAGLSPRLAPSRAVRLLQGAALEQLTMMVTLASGPKTASVSSQRSTCLSQVRCILTGAGEALSGVTTLTLDRRRSTRAQRDGLASMLGAVFSSLAPALPSLQHLRLEGQCWEAALRAFGASCPRLVSLWVAADTVPVAALHGFSTHLPDLESLTICGHGMSDREEDSRITPFLDTALAETRGCARLTSLVLDLPSMVLRCRRSSWSGLPAGLTRFHCPCLVRDSPEFGRLVRRVPRLLLYRCPFSTMLELQDHFPVLEEFDTAEEGDFGGGGGAALLGLPGRPSRRRTAAAPPHQAPPPGLCDGRARHGEEQVLCLEQLACTFPGAWCVMLTGERSFPAGSDSDEEEPGVDASTELDFYAPLTAFPGLTSLYLSVEGMTLTTGDMLQLCTDMGALSSLTLGDSCTGVDKEALAAGLRDQGRESLQVS